MTGIPERLRNEAVASEELDPTDSSIVVMREAADLCEEMIGPLTALWTS